MYCADCKTELNTLSRLVGKGKNKKVVCFKCARKYIPNAPEKPHNKRRNALNRKVIETVTP